MKYSAVILAAGSGTRAGLGYNKLLYKRDGQTIIETTVEVFENDDDCEQIVLVVSHEDEVAMKQLFHDRVTYVFGGNKRQISSYHGVSAANSDYVMIHDGARPYVSRAELERCKEALRKDDACLLMVPLKDTVKVVENGIVVETPLRSSLMAALTPQCFKKKLILSCLERAVDSDEEFSDDASVVEKLSHTAVRVVAGDYSNIKITTKEDL